MTFKFIKRIGCLLLLVLFAASGTLHAQLDLTAQAQGNTIVLNWTLEGEHDVLVFAIFRRTTGDFIQVGTEIPGQSLYVDGDVQEGVAYTYRVSVQDSDLNMILNSNEVTISIGPPPAPGQLIAVPQGQGIELTWQPVQGPNMLRYRIYRQAESENVFSRLDSLDARVALSPYMDQNVVGGIMYTYQVTSVNQDFLESVPSNLASARLPLREGPAPPPATASTGGGGLMKWVLIGGGTTAAGLVACLVSFCKSDDGGNGGVTGGFPTPPDFPVK